MTAAIATEGLGRRYRRLWALADCTLAIPAGHVVGLVGPSGFHHSHPGSHCRVWQASRPDRVDAAFHPVPTGSMTHRPGRRLDQPRGWRDAVSDVVIQR